MLFAWSGSRGTSFGPHIWRGETAVLNYHTWKIEVDENSVNPDFYYFALRNLTAYIEDQAHGASALVHTQKWEMEGFELALPSDWREQRAIAGVLSDVDAALAGLGRLIAKKKDLKLATMQQLLTGQTRLPGFTAPWEVKRLGEVCSMKSGEQITVARIDGYSAYPCYGGNGLRGQTSRFTHEGHFCLIGRQGALCGNVVEVQGKFFASEHAIVVTPNAGVSIGWLSISLKRMNLNQYSESSAQPGLSVNKLLMLDLNVPPTPDEQTAIAAVLSDMDAELAALNAQLEKTKLLKQAMMQELLTGRTRLPLPPEPEAPDARPL